ncbi:MAG TPA: type II toxin-antitoxin system HicA family toxin [Thermomicrobiales bacterium]|nr:addiction module toxin, HicA family [Chloroflexota bacterium]HQX63848.1 type II toxin-antitoxin system HicA family toxin [Thermomicrobiales bacterium]HBY45454.1 addiction module toxin, HicA family [Chloroflexota bacterium]HCG30212.1 addiction module toxin, HicA family [Chloroflexota bacterium]HQZ90940.1 type II toxin-antitoxin system HicA family toxin [Thermomicrobiales bacterium]
MRELSQRWPPLAGDKLPQLTARELIRALRRDGWHLERTRGSHQHFSHDYKPGIVTIPVHSGRDVPLLVVRSILKQANLTEEEFRNLL